MPIRLFFGCLFLALIAGSSCSRGHRGTADRVILIGLDGLDWQVLRPLLDDGQMPNFRRFLDRGASGSLATLLPTYSPIIWASTITGKLPTKHGIDHFFKGVADSSGTVKKVPYSSNCRRVKALWNILGESGRSVASVGWWTTWPAEPINGIMVSDRMIANRFNVWVPGWGAGVDLAHQTHPPEFVDEIRDLTELESTIEQEFFDRLLPTHPDRTIRCDLHDPVYELLLAYGRDSSYLKILDRVVRGQNYDFLAFYLNGIDIACHYLWKYRFPEQWDEPVDEERRLRFAAVIDRYCRFVDESIGHLLARADAETMVVVVSDHGFRAGRRADSPNISGTHYRSRPPGVIAIAGGPVTPGTVIDGASVLDVAPTILHVLGHEVGEDMDGTVLDAVRPMVEGRREAVRYCPTFETPFPEGRSFEPIPSDYDEQRIQRLRALGYLEGEE